MYRWRLWAGLGARRGGAVVGCVVSWAHGSDPARAAAAVDGPGVPPTDIRLTLPSAAGEERFRAVAVDPSSAAALRFAVTPLPPESVASLTFQQQQVAATVLAGGTGAPTVIGGTRSKMVLAVPGTGLLTARMLEPGVPPPPDAIIYAVSAEGPGAAEEAPAAPAENNRAEAELPAEAEASAPALPAEPSRRQAPRSPARPAPGLLLDSAAAAPAPSLQSAPPHQASSQRRCVRNPRPFLLLPCCQYWLSLTRCAVQRPVAGCGGEVIPAASGGGGGTGSGRRGEGSCSKRSCRVSCW